MMRRALLVLALAATGCANIEKTTRTERGPLLRTFERPQVLEGGVKGEVRATWPVLSVSLVGFDTCRSQQVEEYAEERITERRAPAVGPAISLGLIGTLGGGGLLAFTPVFDDHPNTRVIDEGGRYGPSTRSYTVGVGITMLAVGVPALVVGIIQALQSGEDTEVTKVEQVRTQRDVRCNDRPVEGPVELVSERGKTAQAVVAKGEATFGPEALGGDAAESFRFFGREVELDHASRAILDGFYACASLEKEAAPAPAELSAALLVRRIEKVRSCRDVRTDAMKAELDALHADLQRRRDSGERVMGPRATSWEDAVSGWAPRLHFAEGSTDVSKLESDEALVGAVATLEGTVAEGITQNIGVVSVAGHEVFLYLPADPPWGEGDFPAGTRVEAVAVIAGRHTVGERTLPLLRAVWLRRK